MKKFFGFLLVSAFLVPALLDVGEAYSQSAHPFGDGSSNDPFGKDPFGGDLRTEDRREMTPPQLPVKKKDESVLKISPVAQTKSEAAIAAKLDDLTTQTFIETPLSEAMQQIATSHNLPIVIDRRALEEIGLDADVGVTIDLRNVSLRSYLRLMLRDFDLTYLIKDEVLQITTREAADQNLVTMMYTLPKEFEGKSDLVVKALTTAVCPDCWDSLGGPSTAVTLDHVLIISSTSDVQSQTQNFLAKLYLAFLRK